MIKYKNFCCSKKFILKFILLFTIVMESLIVIFKLPELIRYFNDVLLIIVIILKGEDSKNNLITIFLRIILLFLLFSFSSLINFVKIPLWIWGIRNTFRGIIYFYLVANNLYEEDINKIMNTLFYIQIVNLVLALYQFFILHHHQDFIGGIFGYGNGAGVNSFNFMLIAYYINMYLDKKIEFVKVLLVIFMSLTIAAVSEEKITYLFFVIIIFITIIFQKLSLKKIMVFAISIFLLFIGLNILKSSYPEMYQVVTNIDNMIEYSQKTYDEGYRIPRIGAIKKINKLFFNNKYSFWGIGLGNADDSQVSIFKSDFYKKYGDYNYRWFTQQWVYIETGIFGLCSYWLFFIFLIFDMIKKIISNNTKNKAFCIISLCCIVCSMFTILYNNTLKNDMAYIAFFAMTFGFIKGEEIKDDKCNCSSL